MSRRPSASTSRNRKRTTSRIRLGGREWFLLIGASALAVLAAWWVLEDGAGLNGRQTAVIVDQLSLTDPGPQFVESATLMLEDLGFEVDYVPGEQVSVGYYRGLADQGYDLIVLRSHSARIMDGDIETDDVALFTGELIDLGYYNIKDVPPPAATAVAEVKAQGGLGSGGPAIEERLTPDQVRHVIPVYYEPESGELPFFGLQPTFFEDMVVGDFDGAQVVLMGCDGMRSDRLAQAFVSKGAQSFVSWDKPVSASHSDQATQRLLQLHLVEGIGLNDAVERTMDELGPDPTYKGRLALFPSEMER